MKILVLVKLKNIAFFLFNAIFNFEKAVKDF